MDNLELRLLKTTVTLQKFLSLPSQKIWVEVVSGKWAIDKLESNRLELETMLIIINDIGDLKESIEEARERKRLKKVKRNESPDTPRD